MSINRVAFFHGMESKPVSEKNKVLESEFSFVYAPPMNYRDPSLFRAVLNQVKESNIELLIGSSMGGWFAYCISSLTGAGMRPFTHGLRGCIDFWAVRPRRLGKGSLALLMPTKSGLSAPA